MAEEPNSVAAWPKEHVPDEDVLFLRVHQNYLRGRPVLIPPGVIPPGVFTNKPTPTDGMSTNWKKYCSALNSHHVMWWISTTIGWLAEFGSVVPTT
jgi:hypothetical protein